MMKALLRLAAVRDTKQAGELRGDTVQFIASSSALVLMTQNANIYRPLTQTATCLLRRYSSKHIAAVTPTYWRQHIGALFFGHKSPAARARELFKPSTDSASLVVKVEKKFFVLGFRFSGGNVISRGVSVLFWPSFPGPGRCPNGPLFGLKV